MGRGENLLERLSQATISARQWTIRIMLKTLKSRTKSKVILGPEHQGQRMSLSQFEPAKGQEGCNFELARGIVVVSDVPDIPHMDQVWVVRESMFEYYTQHAGLIYRIAGAGECKLLLWDMASERHPDLAIYLKPPPKVRGSRVWSMWIPEIVIEIVSADSKDRDYVEKREEYWTLGVKEYWIVDAELGQIMALRRGRGQWLQKILGPSDYLETKLLPGFRLACRKVLDLGQSR